MSNQYSDWRRVPILSPERLKPQFIKKTQCLDELDYWQRFILISITVTFGLPTIYVILYLVAFSILNKHCGWLFLSPFPVYLLNVLSSLIVLVTAVGLFSI
jgi:hypothetical protein